MLPAEPVLKKAHADRDTARKPFIMLSDGLFSSSKSPKSNEIRARHKALHASEKVFEVIQSRVG